MAFNDSTPAGAMTWWEGAHGYVLFYELNAVLVLTPMNAAGANGVPDGSGGRWTCKAFGMVATIEGLRGLDEAKRWAIGQARQWLKVIGDKLPDAPTVCYLLVRFPISGTFEDCQARDAAVVKAAGVDKYGWGTVAGQQRLQFQFRVEADAVAAKARVDALPIAGLTSQVDVLTG